MFIQSLSENLKFRDKEARGGEAKRRGDFCTVRDLLLF